MPSPRDRGRTYRKPRADAYTVMLAIALAALLLGILFLCLEMNLYEFEIRGGPVAMAGAFGGFCGSRLFRT